MKKHYNNFNDFMAALDTLAKKQVKHYINDWIDYDIPRLNKLNASKEKIDKKLVLILRNCGTWLIWADDIKNPETFSHTVFYYYLPGGPDNPTQNPNKYYSLDLINYTIELLKLDNNGRIITKNRKPAKKAA